MKLPWGQYILTFLQTSVCLSKKCLLGQKESTLSKFLRPSVRPSARPSDCPSDCPSVRPSDCPSVRPFVLSFVRPSVFCRLVLWTTHTLSLAFFINSHSKTVRISWLWHYLHYLSFPLYIGSWSEPFSRHTLWLLFNYLVWGGGSEQIVSIYVSIDLINSLNIVSRCVDICWPRKNIV